MIKNEKSAKYYQTEYLNIFIWNKNEEFKNYKKYIIDINNGKESRVDS